MSSVLAPAAVRTLAWQSEGGCGNRAVHGGGVGTSPVAVSELSPPPPRDARGAVPTPHTHNGPSVPQAQMETVSEKAKGPGRQPYPRPGGACKPLSCRGVNCPCPHPHPWRILGPKEAPACFLS